MRLANRSLILSCCAALVIPGLLFMLQSKDPARDATAKSESGAAPESRIPGVPGPRPKDGAPPPAVASKPDVWSETEGGKEWVRLGRKTLLTEYEKELREKLLRNPVLTAAAIARLNHDGPKDWSREDESDRLHSVDLIRSLLASEDPSVVRAGIEAVTEVIAAPLGSYYPTETHQLRSRLGDRIELMKAVLVRHPSEFSRLVDATGDLRTLKTLEWLVQENIQSKGKKS